MLSALASCHKLEPAKKPPTQPTTAVTESQAKSKLAAPARKPVKPYAATPSHKLASKPAPPPELEYRELKAEAILAEESTSYLTLDPLRQELAIRLKGAVVWSQHLNWAEQDSNEARRFFTRFYANGAGLVRPLAAKYLFAAQDRIPDSLVAQVSKILDVKPELLQRELPSRFHMVWGEGLLLEVQTDVKGESRYDTHLALIRARNLFRHLLGTPRLRVQMPAEAALTLYRAIHPGMPTLIYP